jgi:hypothetical protein
MEAHLNHKVPGEAPVPETQRSASPAVGALTFSRPSSWVTGNRDSRLCTPFGGGHDLAY